MTDAFYASFRLPDLIFSLLVLGALSSAFIPVFVEKLSNNHEEDARHIVGSRIQAFLEEIIRLRLVINNYIGALIKDTSEKIKEPPKEENKTKDRPETTNN